MEEDLSLTLESMNQCRHIGGPFGVVFHSQTNGEVADTSMEDDLSLILELMDQCRHIF